MGGCMTRDMIQPGAGAIARGVLRLLGDLGYCGLREMTLANGRRADVVAIGKKGELVIAEIKSSVADFRADAKWPEYMPYCDQFYFAVSHGFPSNLIPEEAGLIIADGFGGAILREPARSRLAPARRRAMTLRFAHAAASRLTCKDDITVLDTI